jgi:hypothetical protein
VGRQPQEPYRESFRELLCRAVLPNKLNLIGVAEELLLASLPLTLPTF